jgi:hypothetical protein
MDRLRGHAPVLSCAAARFNFRSSSTGPISISTEVIIVSVAIAALLAAQAVLSAAILGTNYYGVDGKLAQATIIAAFKFGIPFTVNNISPISGMGAQILPMNAWANPAYWPFAFLDKEIAADASAVVAMGFFFLSCFFMIRCFDVPVLPSILAAQSTVLLFAPTLFLLRMPFVFSTAPGNAVVYAPHLIALGLLARVKPGPWRNVALATAAIAILLFYSLSCDPLWTTVNGFSWALPFLVVTVGARARTILMRSAVLGCCVAFLVVSGAAEYLYTLSQYTSRVQFSWVVDRPRGPNMVSALVYSPTMRVFYATCIFGWLLGLATLSGRSRLLVIAGILSFIAWIAYSFVYLLILSKPWFPPIPMYVEQCLCPLYLAAAAAGYWGALGLVAQWGYRLVNFTDSAARSSQASRSPLWRDRFARSPRLAVAVLPFLLVAIIPGAMANIALSRAEPLHERYNERWPNEPVVSKLLEDNLGQAIGETFRGSILFWNPSTEVSRDALGGYAANLTMESAWARGVPTLNEYSQLVTPQALYFIHKMFQKDVRAHMNVFFAPLHIAGSYSKSYWDVLRMLGVRYLMGFERLTIADDIGSPPITLPHTVLEKEPPAWEIYELPSPNVGDFSPTQVLTASTAGEITMLLAKPGFDFDRQAVLETAIQEPLVPAREMRMVRIRGSIHVSGKSNGTSLVILPQQFTHCLRARDERVRLVRANLMMTGVIFTGELNTDILFDYGIFSPRCRRADLVDVNRLGMAIDLRMPHLTGDRLFPDWDGGLKRLGEAMSAILRSRPQ